MADHAYLGAFSSTVATDRTEAARRAARLNALNGAYRAQVGVAYATEVQGYLRAGGEAEKAGEDTSPYEAAVRSSFAAAEIAFKDAIAFQPDEYDNYVALANLFNLGGEALDKRFYDSAIAVARQGLEVEPYGTAIRVQLARALLNTGKTAEGIRELEYSVSIDPTGGDAALLLAQVYANQGRPAKALALLKSLEAIASRPARHRRGDHAARGKAPRRRRSGLGARVGSLPVREKGRAGTTRSLSSLVGDRSRCPCGSDQLELALEIGLRARPDDLLGRLAVLEQDDRRDAHDAELAGDPRVLIDVDLADRTPCRRGPGRSRR